ncbi:MAG: hypothetical protein K8R25_18520, partial [Methanosarcinales archaeon]|nr:hypothetical protein [Methanosarcinales archaeon]
SIMKLKHFTEMKMGLNSYNFRNNEQFEDADHAYYKYRRQSQKQEFFSISWIKDVFMWILCGYGVRPFNALFVGGFIILFFSCTSYKNENILFWDEDERKSDGYNGIIQNINKIKSNFFYKEFLQIINKIVPLRLKIFTPSFCSIYISYVTFINLSTIKPKKGRDRFAFMVEGLLGWLILAMFIITLVNVMIRP